MHKKSRTERTYHQKLHKRLFVISGIILVLLIAAATAAYFYRDNILSKLNDGDQAAVPQATIPGTQTISEATELIRNGSGAEADAKLDAAIAATDNKKEQANFYSLKASSSASSNVPQAIEYAIEAANLDPSAGLYAYVAELAERTNNTALAIEYYQKAIEWYKANPPVETNSRGAEDYQTKIDLLRQQ